MTAQANTGRANGDVGYSGASYGGRWSPPRGKDEVSRLRGESISGTMPTRFGAALFDSSEDSGPGWRCVDGEDPVRFSGPNELSSDTFWLTNLKYDAWSLCRTGWIKPENYLKYPPSSLFREWGISSWPVEKKVVFLAARFRRYMETCLQALSKITDEGESPLLRLKGYSLSQDISAMFEDPELPAREHRFPLVNARQVNTMTQISRVPDAVMVYLRAPRISHFLPLIVAPYPKGNPSFVPEADLPEDLEERRRHVYETEFPSLWKIHSVSSRGLPGQIFAYGSSGRGEYSGGDAGAGPSGYRGFVTDVEARVMIEQGIDFQVIEGWTYPESKPLMLKLDDQVGGWIKNLDIGQFDWALGAFLEAIFLSLTKAERVKKEPRIYPARECWARTYDRMATFRLALALAEKGWAVSEYALGQIRALVHPSQIQSLLRDAFAVGLVPQNSLLLDYPDARSDLARSEWGGSQLEYPEAWMRLSGEMDTLHRIEMAPRDHLYGEYGRKYITSIMSEDDDLRLMIENGEYAPDDEDEYSE